MAKLLTIWSVMYYLTEIGSKWRGDDHKANQMVRTVKGDPFNGYFEVTIKGKRKRFDKDNCQDFLPLLLRIVAQKVAELVPKGELSIVPIPNSTASVNRKGEEFRTLAHASAIAQAVGPRAEAVPALRWQQEKLQAHNGGGRDPQVHFQNLVVVQKPKRPVVLFDDVMTSGSQLIGACRRLAKSGVSAPLCAVVVGRATKEQHDRVFGWVEEQLEIEPDPLNWDALFENL